MVTYLGGSILITIFALSGSIVSYNLHASFEFYLVVRFAEDSFDYQLKSDGTVEILNLSLIEVLE